MRLRARSLVTAVVVGALVSACTGDSLPPAKSPQQLASSSPPPSMASPTPSANPTADASAGETRAPQPPPDLSSAEEPGAAAAARYFVSLYGYVMHTGDTEPWAAMSADVCGFCERIEADATAISDRGETYTGGEIHLSDLQVLPKDDLIGGYPVDARFDQTPVRHIASDGSIINETEGYSGTVRIDTIHTAGSWRILAVVVQDG